VCVRVVYMYMCLWVSRYESNLSELRDTILRGKEGVTSWCQTWGSEIGRFRDQIVTWREALAAAQVAPMC